MSDKKKNKDDVRIPIEDNTQEYGSTSTGPATAIGVGGALVGTKMLYDAAAPVVSRGAKVSMDAAKAFKNDPKGSLKGAYKNFGKVKNIFVKPETGLSIYQPDAEHLAGMQPTKAGGAKLPKSAPDFPTIGKDAYKKGANKQLYNQLSTIAGEGNVVPSPSGKPTFGSLSERGKSIRYGKGLARHFETTPAVQAAMETAELKIAQAQADNFISKNAGQFNDLSDAGPGKKHITLSKPTKMKGEMINLNTHTPSGRERKKVIPGKPNYQLSTNPASGSTYTGMDLDTAGRPQGKSKVVAQVPTNLQHAKNQSATNINKAINQGIADVDAAMQKQMNKAIGFEKGGVKQTGQVTNVIGKTAPKSGSIATKSVQLLGGRAAMLGLGAKGVPFLGNTLMAADVAGVSYGTAAKTVTAQTPAKRVSAGIQAGKEITDTWKNRASSFKSWTQSNMAKSRERKAQIKKDIYGQTVKKK